MPTVTQATYLRRLIDRLYPDSYQRYGTASSGTTTTLVNAAMFATSFTQTSSLVGQWIRVTTSSSTEYALIASVTAASGTLTFDRAITAVGATSTFEITGTRHPAQLERMIDIILENIYEPALFPLNSVAMLNDDWDMESTATITGMWSNTNGTLAKSTTVVPLLGGTQSLSVTASATPGYARLANTIPVTAGEQYWASVLESTTSGDDAEFRIVNVSDSNATIENATTDEITWNELSFYFTPPSGCELIDAWLMSTTNLDVTYWDDLQIIRTNQRIFPTPSWMTLPAQFIDVIEFPRGSGDPSNDNGYLTLDNNWRSCGSLAGPVHFKSNQELAVQTYEFSGNRRYIYAKAPGTALSSNTGVGYLSVDSVVENALKLIEAQDSEGGRLATWRLLANLREATLGAGVEQPAQHAMAYFA